MAADVVLVLTTVPVTDQVDALARTLVDEQLAACVNLLAPMTSFYRWEGRVERASERQLIIKTSRAMLDRLRARLKELHTYELPEFVVIDVAGGSPEYLDWILRSTAGPHSSTQS